MLKLHSLLKSRVSISEKFASRSNKTLDGLGFDGVINRAGISTYGQNSRSNLSNDRIFAPYSIYKGKTAFSAYPVPPQFGQVNSGGLTVKRQGYIMLNFSPAIGERKYNWEKKQLFALSATEVGSVINLGPKGSCEFFHDPAMKSSNAGQVRKNLSIKANPDGTGYFITLNVTNNVTKTNERLMLPVTAAEFAVMRTSFSFALPHIMGWDRYSNQAPKLEDKSANKGSLGLGSEWDR